MGELKYNKINTKVNFDKLVFDDNKILGSGAFGNVYKAYNGKNMNNRLVVKHTRKTLGLQLFSLIVNQQFQGPMFKKEVNALKYLSKQGIAPKIYFSNEKKMVYVIEKLDYTLTNLLNKKKFNAHHLKKLIDIFNKLKTTPFKHNDLHTSNIMYSEKTKRFYIIDWGIFKIKSSCLENMSQKNKKSKKTKKAKKAPTCYNFNENDVKVIDNLFRYILIHISNQKNTLMEKYLLKFLDIFNIKSIDELKNIIL